MKTKSICYLGMHAEGETVTAAKRKAEAKLERLVKELFSPHVETVDGNVLIVHRGADGWGYTIVWAAQLANREKPRQRIWSTCEIGPAETTTEDQARRQGLRHIAQAVSSIDHVRVDLVDDEHDRRNLVEYFEWQRRYRIATAAGYDDEDARYIASGAHQLVKRHPKPADCSQPAPQPTES